MSYADTDHEVSDFQHEVIESSHEVPVLVDFWAPWCGPCRMLGPVLEKLADENDGKWRLVKVNTDVHPEVSAQYGIRGIPAVKLFVEGQVADEFTGALPEHAVRQWLENALPSENKARLEKAEAALAADDEKQAETLLREVMRAEPGHPQAAGLLARLLAFRDPKYADTLAQTAANQDPSFMPVLEAIRSLARMKHVEQEPDELPDDPGKDEYLAAAKALTQGDYGTALKQFIDVIQKNRYFDDDGSRKACVALFALLGNEHPAVQKWRRTFDMVLY